MIDDLLAGPHLVILLLILVVFFGGKRLPDVARGLGQSLRIFKAEVNALHSDDEAGDRPRAVAADPGAPPSEVTSPPARLTEDEQAPVRRPEREALER